MINDGGANQMLDATDITHVAAHTAWPGTTFANEVTGGSPAYARKAVSWGSAASRVKTQSGTAVLDIPNTIEVQFLTGATAVSAGSQRCIWVVGGAPKPYDVDPSTDVFQVYAHGYSDNTQIVFVGGSAPTGLTVGTIYFVRDATTDTFKVEASIGGGAIDITARPTTDDVFVSLIVPDTGAQRTLTVSGLTLSLAAGSTV